MSELRKKMQKSTPVFKIIASDDEKKHLFFLLEIIKNKNLSEALILEKNTNVQYNIDKSIGDL